MQSELSTGAKGDWRAAPDQRTHIDMRTFILAAFSLATGLTTAGLVPGASAAQGRIERLETNISELADMSRIMGEAHYLRVVCRGVSDQLWREEMVRLMELEAPEGRRRQRLVQAFNDGYSRQSARHGHCTSQVREDERRLAGEGRRLAERLADRYLN